MIARRDRFSADKPKINSEKRDLCTNKNDPILLKKKKLLSNKPFLTHSTFKRYKSFHVRKSL